MTYCKEFWENYVNFAKKKFKNLHKLFWTLCYFTKFFTVIYGNFRKILSISVRILSIIIKKKLLRKSNVLKKY